MGTRPPKVKIDVDEDLAEALKKSYYPLNLTNIVKFLGQTALAKKLDLQPYSGITISPKDTSQK